MAFIRWIIGFIITVAIATFAAMNLQHVDVVFNTLDEEQTISLPLYVIMMGSLVLGFVFGGLTVWFNEGKNRREKRKAKKEVKSLEKTVHELKENRFVVPPTTDIKETKGSVLISGH